MIAFAPARPPAEWTNPTTRAAAFEWGTYPLAKRVIDVVASLILLAALAPVFAVIAVLIRATDRGPVFFAQARVGRGGREFRFYKYRTMTPDAERRKAALLAANDHGGSITFKMRHDPRVTWVGRHLRRLSLDELPQLWNVLRGDMSLVGPRPAIPAEVARYSDRDRRRLDVAPGLTCLWQVSGRGDLPFEHQVELDLDYIARRSLLLDAGLILRTVPAVLSGRGAY